MTYRPPRWRTLRSLLGKEHTIQHRDNGLSNCIQNRSSSSQYTFDKTVSVLNTNYKDQAQRSNQACIEYTEANLCLYRIVRNWKLVLHRDCTNGSDRLRDMSRSNTMCKPYQKSIACSSFPKQHYKVGIVRCR